MDHADHDDQDGRSDHDDHAGTTDRAGQTDRTGHDDGFGAGRAAARSGADGRAVDAESAARTVTATGPSGRVATGDGRGGRPDRRVFLGLLAGGAVAAVGGVAAWRVLADDPAPVATAPAPTTAPQLRVTKATLPPLPIPDPLPQNPNADTPQVVIGTIELPRIGVTADIQEGVTLTAINRGPGHWPNTALPGALGNVVIAGHRTTYSRPFNRLNELEPGDVVTMTTAEGRFDYQVRGVVIVPGEAIDIASQSYAHTATLFACHPPGSARQRIVAKLRLLDATGAPVDPDDALPPLEAGTQATDHTLTVRAAPDPLSAGGT